MSRLEELQKENDALRQENAQLKARVKLMRDKLIEAQFRIRKISWMLQRKEEENE